MSSLREVHHSAMDRGANQEADELLYAGAVLELCKPIHRVLEIGNASGGTLWYWAQFATENAEIMGIDISHHDIYDENRDTGHSGQRHYLHLGASEDPASIEAAKQFFTGPLDLLFIDGDHSYAVSSWEYATYGPMVREGGWVMFHDVHDSYTHDGGVCKLWHELIDHRGHFHDLPCYVEIFLRQAGGMGIGMLRKR